MIKTANQLKYMSWPTIYQKVTSGYKTVIIVLASIEQHGPHLPECTDETIGLGLACGLAERIKNTLIAPPIIPGMSEHHISFPGSLSLAPEVFKALVESYVDCYSRHGFQRFIFIPSHGGKLQIAEQIVIDMKSKYPKLFFISLLNLRFLADFTRLLEKRFDLSVGSIGGHACIFETALMLYLEADLVDMSVVESGYIGLQDNEFISKLFRFGIAGVSPNGILGDPTHATIMLGKCFYEAALEEFVKKITATNEFAIL